ncbi:MAG TPA: cytochrome c oxidase subunit II [Gemmatimonadaceae bacterium]|nr:cytochrome c oxidase subunit II [Gemmatimonadaceae bacterium]
MPADSRPRRLFRAALTVALASLIAGCVQNPNSVFHNRTDFNRDVGSLFSLLIWLGTIVFVFTEVMLVWALIKYRSRPGSPRKPEQTHGNTKLEILWTAIPAVVLAIIAVPTVQTIFKTQGAARADALRVEVVGHQWWWEFRYPDYGVVTANELYLPLGRTVNFALSTHDVIHSFWIPALGGKRDLVNNRTNHLWFTPDSTTDDAFNGYCAEFCGISHANMRFRAFTVTPEQFASWVAHQQSSAVFHPQPATPATTPGTAGAAAATAPRTPVAVAPAPGAQPVPPPTAPVQAGFVSFPADKMPNHAIPKTPIPPGLAVDTTLKGDPARGMQLVSTGACIGCHTVKGVPSMVSKVGPDLTHVGSRLTIGGGLFPNDTRHLFAWIKNARAMKPGIQMPTMGKGQYDPIVKTTLTVGYTDQQIADVVAYLQALK